MSADGGRQEGQKTFYILFPNNHKMFLADCGFIITFVTKSNKY